MTRVARIAATYALIAVLATAVNIACQAAANFAYAGPFAIPLSVVIGTAAGLPVKYLLEKRFIFRFTSQGLRHDGRLFVVYSFFGLFTTSLFWGVEYAFHASFGTDTMRYVGGAIGLTLGYWIKYHLDKHFVFVAPREAAAA